MGNFVAAVYSDGNLWVSRDSPCSLSIDGGNSWFNIRTSLSPYKPRLASNAVLVAYGRPPARPVHTVTALT